MSKCPQRSAAASKSAASEADVPTGNPLSVLAQLYVYALFARILLSWFPISPESPMSSVFRVLYAITEPVLGPVRRVLPPMGGFDFSPAIVLIVFQIAIIPTLNRL